MCVQSIGQTPLTPLDAERSRCMTYRGEGGWSWPLSIGQLDKLVRKYLKHVATEEFFELC